METLKYFLCGLRGHEEYLRFEPNRLFLECVACGHESPGWAIGRQGAGTADAGRRTTSARMILGHLHKAA